VGQSSKEVGIMKEKDVTFAILFMLFGYVLFSWLSWDLLWMIPEIIAGEEKIGSSSIGRLFYFILFILLPNVIRHINTINNFRKRLGL
jgi:hypothetical protein